jgi:gamma-glutamylcyclotransferase (GGCT)/AIG2-like uncharacterized protein YtfP
MGPAYQLARAHAIPLRVTPSLPRFVPLSASELAQAEPSTAVFVGDVRVEPGPKGSAAQLVHAPGSALPGRIDAEVAAAQPSITARAVRSDGTLLDVWVGAIPRAASEPLVAGVFVYGTLMHGEERESAILGVLSSVAPVDGWVTGALVHLGAWPGLVGGVGQVHGELFVTPELAPLLTVLDPIEDFTGFHAPPTDYVRVVLPVTTDNGRVWAWVYRYVGDVTHAVPIPTGRWRDAPRRLGNARRS